jgi:hypothetical protein
MLPCAVIRNVGTIARMPTKWCMCHITSACARPPIQLVDRPLQQIVRQLEVPSNGRAGCGQPGSQGGTADHDRQPGGRVAFQ